MELQDQTANQSFPIGLKDSFREGVDNKKRRRGFVPETVDTFNYEYKTIRWLYYLIGAPLVVIFRFLWKFRIEGIENIPDNHHAIFMPNHISHFDSFAVGYPLYPKKALHFIADEKLFKNRFFAWFAKRLNVFPVRKGAKQLDVVHYAINLARSGSSLIWYPEGQRNKTPWNNKLNPGKVGSGWIAHQTHVPVIPVFLSGPELVMPVGKGVTWGRGPRTINILVRFGKPVYLDDLRAAPASKEVSQIVVDRIVQAIEQLRPVPGNK